MPDALSTVRVEQFALPPVNLPADLRNAFSSLESQDPQLGLDWLSTIAAHALDPGDSAVLLVARDDEQSLAALPLRISASRRASALANFYCTSYSPLLQGPRSGALLCKLLRHLAEELSPSILTLSPLDPCTGIFQTLREALSGAGWSGVHEFDCFANWTHDLAGADWKDYLEQRPSRVRNTVKRRTRRFEREGGELRLVKAGADLETAIEQFTTIYDASWKRPEPYPSFIPALLRLAAGRGWLRLGLADFQGQAIAAQVWLVAGDTAYIYKLAYRRGFEQWSPGTVLTAFLMAQVIDDDGVSTIDYLSGDDHYKQDWMSRRGTRRGLAAYNPRTVRGLLSAVMRYVRQLLSYRRGEKPSA